MNNLPAQSSAAARLLRDLNENLSLLLRDDEIAATLSAADELDALGWSFRLDHVTSRSLRDKPADVHMSIELADHRVFFGWCDSPNGQAWLAGVGDAPISAPTVHWQEV